MGKTPKDETDPSQPAEDDATLWERLAGTVSPLRKRPPPAGPVPQGPPKQTPERKASAGADSAPPAPQPLPRKPPPAPPAPSSVALDRGTARKLAKGRLTVEARLDLHGMRQQNAHAALRGFLTDAQAKGLRHVLVITGKGTAKASSDAENFSMEDRRGVLRQQVPGWLAAPDLAPLVVSFSEAPQRLGGAGALYVRLRKLR